LVLHLKTKTWKTMQVDLGQIPAEQAAVLILLCAPETDGATTWLRAEDNLHHE
jgi:hypothetical protein